MSMCVFFCFTTPLNHTLNTNHLTEDHTTFVYINKLLFYYPLGYYLISGAYFIIIDVYVLGSCSKFVS